MSKKDYKVESMDIQNAFDQKAKYPYALIYCYSDVKLCRTSDLSDKDLEECKEARFFGPEGELHVMSEEGRAVLVTENDQAAVIDKTYQLSKRFLGDWKQVTVRQYLESDVDGQMQIVLTRLTDLK